MKLRPVVVTGSALLLAVAISAVAGLTLATVVQRRLAVRLAHVTAVIRSVDEIDRALFVHKRESTLFMLSGSLEHRQAAREAQALVERSLDEARRGIESREVQALVEQTEADAARYFAAVAAAEAAGRSPLESDPAVFRSLEDTHDAAELLMATSLHRSEEEQASMERWFRAEGVAGVCLAALIAVLVTALLVGTRGQVVRPLRHIAHAIHRYGLGDRNARAPQAGLAELQEISRRFNETADALERSREAQLGFLAAVAHDLRNPLTALKAGASTVARADAPVALVKQVMALVVRQVERLERMVGDLLDATAIEAGRLEMRRQPTALCELARHAAGLFTACGSERQISVSAPAGEVTVVCDPVRIEQVLSNLLSNALKYSPPDSAVEVSVASAGDGAVIAVRDHGVGIPPDEHEKVFEPFRRASTSPDGVPGIGLGLSVVRRIVEAHHGRIELQSTPGHGSTFTVRLPRDPQVASCGADDRAHRAGSPAFHSR